MLLWKTTLSPPVRTKSLRQPLPKPRRVPRQFNKVSRSSQYDSDAGKREVGTYRNDQRRYSVTVLLAMLVVLLVTVILVLL